MKKKFKKITGFLTIPAKIKIYFSEEPVENKGGDAAPVMKKGKYHHSIINVYGEENLKEETIAHEFMHSFREAKTSIYDKYPVKLSKTIHGNKKAFLYTVLEYPIQEAAAELFEIVYSLENYGELKEILHYHILCIKANCEFLNGISPDVEFMKLIRSKNYDIPNPIEYINESAGIEDRNSYCIIWLYGIFIAYLILRYTKFKVKKSLKILGARNN